MAAAAIALQHDGASASADTWTAGSGDWSAGTNWSAGSPPAAGDNTVLTYGGTNAAVITFDAAASIGTGLTTLSIDTMGAGSLNLSLTARPFVASLEEVVASNGQGQFTHTGGINTTGELVVGYGTGATGTYSLNAGTLNGGIEFVGLNGSGIVSQAGGANAASTLTLGVSHAGIGFYLLNSTATATATVNVAGDVRVGDHGAGNFIQSGGTHSIGGNLYVGANGDGVGVYVLTGGLLAVSNSEYVGWGGKGDFNQNGGLHTIAGDFRIGDGLGTHATYTMSAGSVLSVQGLELVGVSGTAGFTQSGGSHTIGGGLYVGDNVGSSATFALSDGTLSISNPTVVGDAGNGTFAQSGGTCTTSTLSLGLVNRVSGSYGMSAGATLVLTSDETIGVHGGGTFTQTGGRHVVGGSLYMATQGDGTAKYTMSGGTLSLPSTNAAEVIGPYGQATFAQSGGTHTVANNVFIGGSPTGAGGGVGLLQVAGGTLSIGGTLKVWASGTSGIALSGGSLSVGTLDTSNDASRLNWTGGSLTLINCEVTTGINPSQGDGNVNFDFGRTLALGGTQALIAPQGEQFGVQYSTQVSQSGGTNSTTSFWLNGNDDGPSTYSLSGGSLTTGGREDVYARYNDSTFSHSGGSNSAGTLALDGASGGTATYLLGAGAALSIKFNEFFGISGTARFRQTGGKNVVGTLSLAYNAGSSGTYELLDGSVSVVGAERLAYDRDTRASFVQSGGTHTVGNTLYLADGFNVADGIGNANASYIMTAGLLAVTKDEDVGYQLGDATLNQSGGTHSVGGNLLIGNLATATGTVTLAGGSLSVLASETIGASGKGVFNQTGGLHTVAGQLTIQSAVGSGGRYTLSGGTLNAQGVVNAGTYLQTGGLATMRTLSGTGSTSVGGGGLLRVGQLAQASVAVSNGGILTVTNVATSTTNVATSLSLSGNGRIDLNANDLITGASLTSVRDYVLAGSTGGTFTGTNGGIYSSVVAADTAHKSIAYLSGANPANAALNPALTNTAAVLIRPSLVGDFNIDGKVDRFDIRAFNARNAFNDGLTTHDWADGDLNFDGKVDRFDIRAFNAGNNFNSGAVFAQAQTLTSATPAAISNTTTVGTVGDGKPDLVYNSTTGDVVFKYDGYAPAAGFTVLELDIASSKNSLNANGVNAAAAGSISKGANDIDYQNLGSTPIADGADLGTIFPTGLTAAQLTTNNITANFFLNGDGSPTKFADVTAPAGVPEPATLSLVGVAAAGLLSRKRRRRGLVAV